MTEQTDLVGAVPARQLLADWHDLVLALGGDDTSFTGDLLRLIAKAAPGNNRERLRLAFPWTVRAWELWMEHAPNITAGELVARVDSDPLTVALTTAADQLRWSPPNTGRWDPPECTGGALPGESMTCGRTRPCPDHDAPKAASDV